jgi:hypothetical protein
LLCSVIRRFAALSALAAAGPGATPMRRILPIIGGLCLVSVLCGAGAVFVRGADDDAVVPGATDLRLDHPDLSHVAISYQLPPDRMLSDIFAFFEDRGWTRDQTFERSLQRTGTSDVNTTLAIFVRQNLFGIVDEVAIVGFAPTYSRIQVRLRRCFKIEPWLRC